MWTLLCPHEAPGLQDRHSEEFERLYEEYERQPGLARRVVKAQDLWFAILESQIETGTPYMLYKDRANQKSNHKHLGTIQSSNLYVATPTRSKKFIRSRFVFVQMYRNHSVHLA